MLHRTEKKGMNILPNMSMLRFRRILIKKAIIKVQALLSAGQKKENKKGNNKGPGSAVGRAKKEISKEQHQPVRVWDDHSRWGKYYEKKLFCFEMY